MYIVIIDRDELIGLFFSIKECQEFIAFHHLEDNAKIERLTAKEAYPFTLK